MRPPCARGHARNRVVLGFSTTSPPYSSRARTISRHRLAGLHPYPWQRGVAHVHVAARGPPPRHEACPQVFRCTARWLRRFGLLRVARVWATASPARYPFPGRHVWPVFEVFHLGSWRRPMHGAAVIPEWGPSTGRLPCLYEALQG